MQNHQLLISEFGTALGLDDLAFDDDGTCRLGFDDYVFDLEYQEPSGEVLITSELGSLPPVLDTALLAGMLELNHAHALMATGSLGIDRAAGRVLFLDRWQLDGMSQTALQARFKRAIESTEAWTQWLKLPALNAGDETGLAPSDQEQVIFA